MASEMRYYLCFPIIAGFLLPFGYLGALILLFGSYGFTTILVHTKNEKNKNDAKLIIVPLAVFLAIVISLIVSYFAGGIFVFKADKMFEFSFLPDPIHTAIFVSVFISSGIIGIIIVIGSEFLLRSRYNPTRKILIVAFMSFGFSASTGLFFPKFSFLNGIPIAFVLFMHLSRYFASKIISLTDDNEVSTNK